MKKLFYTLLLFPSFSFSQDCKIDHKVNDEKTGDIRAQISTPKSITAILEFRWTSKKSTTRTNVQQLNKSQ